MNDPLKDVESTGIMTTLKKWGFTGTLITALSLTWAKDVWNAYRERDRQIDQKLEELDRRVTELEEDTPDY